MFVRFVEWVRAVALSCLAPRGSPWTSGPSPSAHNAGDPCVTSAHVPLGSQLPSPPTWLPVPLAAADRPLPWLRGSVEGPWDHLRCEAPSTPGDRGLGASGSHKAGSTREQCHTLGTAEPGAPERGFAAQAERPGAQQGARARGQASGVCSGPGGTPSVGTPQGGARLAASHRAGPGHPQGRMPPATEEAHVVPLPGPGLLGSAWPAPAVSGSRGPATCGDGRARPAQQIRPAVSALPAN